MEFGSTENSKEPVPKSGESKIERDGACLGCGNEPEESDSKTVNGHSKDGAVAPKPSDVRNGDLVSLLLAATPPYLYNIPLVPQTFFFSEMLKSFVQAKTERQNLKAQQTHARRQRKRSWREISPPKAMTYESKDAPLELTIPKQIDEKHKPHEKSPTKKCQIDNGERRYQHSELGSNNFSVEKLANSSITGNTEATGGNHPGDLLPPAPPFWYPLLYPPHPPYGIDPLHFFVDLRVGKLLEVGASSIADEN